MSLPPYTDPIWSAIISGKKEVDFEFLAIKFFLNNARLLYKSNPSQDSLNKLSVELYTLLSKNANIPSVQKDLLKLNQ